MFGHVFDITFAPFTCHINHSFAPQTMYRFSLRLLAPAMPAAADAATARPPILRSVSIISDRRISN